MRLLIYHETNAGSYGDKNYRLQQGIPEEELQAFKAKVQQVQETRETCSRPCGKKAN